jgi:acyl-CoA synthetase (AMP-forming)/AMP-acid ligase II
MTPAYGLAEATVAVSTWRPGTPTKVDSRGFVSVGRAFPGVEIAISQNGTLVGPNEVGEVLVDSPALCRGYHRNPEATADLFRPDGTIHTGDLGYRDEAGDLFIVGRSKDIIIQAGENIAPQEVEEAVEQIPFVRTSAAVGIDRGRTEGEQVYLFAEIRSARSSPQDKLRNMTVEIVGAIRSRLGFRPGRVYLMTPAALPRTANGKLRRAELKRLYLEGMLRRSGKILFPEY